MSVKIRKGTLPGMVECQEEGGYGGCQNKLFVSQRLGFFPWRVPGAPEGSAASGG